MNHGHDRTVPKEKKPLFNLCLLFGRMDLAFNNKTILSFSYHTIDFTSVSPLSLQCIWYARKKTLPSLRRSSYFGSSLLDTRLHDGSLSLHVWFSRNLLYKCSLSNPLTRKAWLRSHDVEEAIALWIGTNLWMSIDSIYASSPIQWTGFLTTCSSKISSILCIPAIFTSSQLTLIVYIATVHIFWQMEMCRMP